jgi:hypothetical protein
MREATALEVAVGLLQLPSRVRSLRAGELPSDLEMLLRIVAGDHRAISHAVATSDLSTSVVQAAASFYIEQILLHPEADSYRALGARPDATIDQLRRNMALLLRWLHPDREADSARSLFANRVTQAWNNVKTVERRTVYDKMRKIGSNGRSERGPLDPGSTASPQFDEAWAHTLTPSGIFGSGDRRVRRERSRRPGVWGYFKFLWGKRRH